LETVVVVVILWGEKKNEIFVYFLKCMKKNDFEKEVQYDVF
jgi:hypothetical protein